MSREAVKPVSVTYKKRRLHLGACVAEKKNIRTTKERKKNTTCTPANITSKPDKLIESFFWNCPVCGKNFTSEPTKNKHIKVHGAKVVDQAQAEKKKPIKQQAVVAKSSQGRSKRRKELISPSRSKLPHSIKNACRVCGVTPAIPGDDVCYSCHSK